ncbi:MAG: histidine kinase [Bacteroidota bacterium]
MISFLRRYKAFGIGILITLALRIVLEYIGFIRIDNSQWMENIAGFAFWSLAFALPIHNFEYLKKHKKTIFKLFGLIAFFIAILIIDSSADVPDNPLTFILFVAFWMGVLYVISPAFFRKYRYWLTGVYVIILAYFSFVRLTSMSYEAYAADGKETALILLFIPVPVFLLIWAYEQWKWLKSLQEGKAKAELDLLKTQINPHFFFNTLNNLYSLTVKQSEKAPEVVLKLSDMMRYTIYEGKKNFVLLKDEVEYLKSYIDLHKIRYRKPIDTSFDHSIDPNQEIAPLMFIVLLENAIKHGIETLSDGAYLKMSLKSNEQTIQFDIENNFDPNQITEEKGIGLENLKHRLELTYPKKHNLNITEENNVFRVELTIYK